MKGRVFVIGLGLIGGSLAFSIKHTHKDINIIGYDRMEEQEKFAKILGVVDQTVDGIAEGAKEADLIIIATPVKETERILNILSEMPLKKDVIITDAGSTKTKIVKEQKLTD